MGRELVLAKNFRIDDAEMRAKQDGLRIYDVILRKWLRPMIFVLMEVNTKNLDSSILLSNYNRGVLLDEIKKSDLEYRVVASLIEGGEAYLDEEMYYFITGIEIPKE